MPRVSEAMRWDKILASEKTRSSAATTVAPDETDRISVVHDRLKIASPPKSTKISVVLVSYRDDQQMADSVKQLLGMSEVHQVIVVRNGVDAEAQSLPVGSHRAYKEIRSPRNLGFGAGFNLSLPHISGDVTISLNADVGISNDVLARMANLAEARDAIFAPHLYNNEGGEETGRKFYNPWRLALSRSPWRSDALTMKHGAVDWAIGGCLAMKTALLRSLGGFDERYFLYFEDVDLCWRAKERGWPTIVITDRAYHAHRRSSSKLNKTLWWHVVSAARYFQSHPRALMGKGPSQKTVRRYTVAPSPDQPIDIR